MGDTVMEWENAEIAGRVGDTLCPTLEDDQETTDSEDVARRRASPRTAEHHEQGDETWTETASLRT